MTNRHSNRSLSNRWARRVQAAVLPLVVASTLVAGPAWASPRDDVKMAYIDASEQLANLEVDAAIATLEAGLERAEGAGLAGDPSLAPLQAMRGGLLHASGADRTEVLQAFEAAVEADYNVQLPIELRSEELQELLDEARAGADKPPPEAVLHRPPVLTRGQNVEFGALFNIPLPPDAEVVMYWRKLGTDGEYDAVYMDLFGNFATATIPAAEHDDGDLEYFFYAFDGQQQAVANRGDRDNPLELRHGDAGESSGEPGEPTTATKKKAKAEVELPRVFITLGVGTGFGLARGRAELTYEQYTPGDPAVPYGLAEQACALERWVQAAASVSGDANGFATNVNMLSNSNLTSILPANASSEELVMAYDADYCARRHPISTGFASAPFHVAPEVGVRIGNSIVLSAFGRLQVVTGSRVFRDDPNKGISESFNTDVRAPNPEGTRMRPPFTWAVGLKARYFIPLGKQDSKLKLFAGAFVGYGNARLRVPMGFSNDRNGNSVPDSLERAFVGATNAMGMPDPATCIPVWPYNQACAAGAAGQTDRDLAQAVVTNTSGDDERIDTARIGPGFAGALAGVHFQIIDYVAVSAELDIGAWFPSSTSILFDLTIGPVITF